MKSVFRDFYGFHKSQLTKGNIIQILNLGSVILYGLKWSTKTIVYKFKWEIEHNIFLLIKFVLKYLSVRHQLYFVKVKHIMNPRLHVVKSNYLLLLKELVYCSSSIKQINKSICF